MDNDRQLQAPYNPMRVDDVLLVFPAEVTHLMPAETDIPSNFWAHDDTWVMFVERVFSYGYPVNSEFWMVADIDGDLALRHLRAVLGSYQHKHEYKIAAAAFLASLWFSRVVVKGGERRLRKTYGEPVETA